LESCVQMSWRSRQSIVLLVASALILPTIIAIAIGFSTTQNERRRIEEREAATMARHLSELSEAKVSAIHGAMQLIASSKVVAVGDWSSVEQLFDATQRAHPALRALVVRDSTGRVLLERSAGSYGGVLNRLPAKPNQNVFVEGVFREGRHCPCVIIHEWSAAGPDIVVSAYVKPDFFQEILLDRISPGKIAAIVDHKGNFIARSVNFADRVGTPATVYVRRAINNGGYGLYRGVTYEGLKNHTAYYTSTLTGWSTHVAVDNTLIDGPRAKSIAAVAIALTAGLILAIALLLYASHYERARRRDEQKFIQLQKTETLGQFTGIVIHDVRNILSVLWAGLSRIRRLSVQDEAIDPVLEGMEDALKRGEKLVHQLLSFARKGSAEVSTVDLEKLLTGVDRLIRSTLGENISYRWSTGLNARYAVVNGDQLELALINLARNAKDAMGGEGDFCITTELHGEMVEIIVSDTGSGVPKSIRDRLFEPFFTTKGKMAGTGLGLAQVAGTVRQAGGDVKVEDGPQCGTSFRLCLPYGEPQLSP
jgi:signal transduction histidine kinase